MNTDKLKVALINGPNLNLLGKREPEIYGYETFEVFLTRLRKSFPQVEIDYFQSNHEGKLIDYLHEVGFTHDGIVLNAGAYTHTSIALADAVAALKAEVVEVHISNIFARENFRKKNFIAPKAKGSITGLGLDGYRLALEYFIEKNKQELPEPEFA